MSKAVYRDILRHSAVYGAGQILGRVVSVLLLPLYTHYLHPADYGVMAILDLVGALLGGSVGAAFVPAAGRLHFDGEDEIHRSRVWWTTMALVAAVSSAVAGLLVAARMPLASATLGAVPQGAFYYALFAPGIVTGAVEYAVGGYLRIAKASTAYVVLSLARLPVNVGLNVGLLALGYGLSGVLIGNLATGVLSAVAFVAVFVRTRPFCGFRWGLSAELWRFGWPLMLSGVLATLLHQADRYILVRFVSLEEVGIYSLAYQIGQGINALVLMPFASIWGVVILEVRERPDAPQFYADVFKYFVYGLSLLFLAVSLLAPEIVGLLTAPEFWDAARLIPIICLAYLFFSLSDHFKVPAVIHKRTIASLRVMVVATIANIAMNLALVPRFGIDGAAWATLLGFLVMSLAGLYEYRKIEAYPYAFGLCSMAIGAMGATYLCFNATRSVASPTYAVAAAAAAVCAIWAVILFAPLAMSMRMPGPRNKGLANSEVSSRPSELEERQCK